MELIAVLATVAANGLAALILHLLFERRAPSRENPELALEQLGRFVARVRAGEAAKPSPGR